MIILSFKEDHRQINNIPDSGFFLKGDKNLCFLIHGLTGTAKEMGSIGQTLNNRGFSVACPLLANHNKSICTLKHTSWQEIYASIRKEFTKYEKEHENIFVAGLSFGALIGIMLAYEFPSRIKALNCFSPTLFFDGWSNPKSRVFLPILYKTPFKYWMYFKEEFPYGIKNTRLRKKIESFYKDADLFDYSKVHLYGYPVIPVSCMYQNHLLAKKVASILGRVRTPIQLLQAKDDDITSPRNSHFIFKHIGSPDKKIIFFEDSYHIITADQEREKVAQAALDFFEGHKT